jgi:methionyl-tRNA formyltransferase
MRVIFMGTPDFSVPTLDALVGAGHHVSCVVAQPDRPKGRGQKLVSPPTIQRARELGIATRQPRAVRKGPFVEWMCEEEADVAVVIAYGRILVPRLLQAPRLGCINLHASLLPKYRGPAPIHWAVINGETETGVCTMQMDAGMDTGDILLERRTGIGGQETSGELWGRLSEMGAEVVVETLDSLGSIEPQPQDHSLSTHAPMLQKSHGKLDWSLTAKELGNRIRGVSPWPGAWTTFRGGRLKVWTVEEAQGAGRPGEVLSTQGLPVVATGGGALRLLEVQLPGKRRGSAANLVNGSRLQAGEQFGEE